MPIPFQINIDHQTQVEVSVHMPYVVAHIASLRPPGYTVSFGPAKVEIRRWDDWKSWVPKATVDLQADSNRAYVIYNFPSFHGWRSDQQYQIMIPPFYIEVAYPDGHTERFQHSEVKLFGWTK